jgi:hypothetical protein
MVEDSRYRTLDFFRNSARICRDELAALLLAFILAI